MKLQLHRVLSGIALIATAAPALAQKPAELPNPFTVGAVARFKMTRTIPINDMEVSTIETYKETVKEVKADGSFVIERVSEGGIRKLGDTEQEMPAGAKVVRIHDKSGRLISYKEEANGSPAGPEIQQLLNSLIFPLKADGDGEGKVEVDNPVVKSKKASVKVASGGPDKVNGIDCLKLKQTAEAPTDLASAKMVIEYTAWLSIKDGSRQKFEAVIKDFPNPMYGLLTIKVKAERLKDAAK